jgi:hypothetical protein
MVANGEGVEFLAELKALEACARGPQQPVSFSLHNRGRAKNREQWIAQAHRRWTTIGHGSKQWTEWEGATKKFIETRAMPNTTKFIAPPRSANHKHAYIVFALEDFSLQTFTVADGRRFALLRKSDASEPVSEEAPLGTPASEHRKRLAGTTSTAADDLCNDLNLLKGFTQLETQKDKTIEMQRATIAKKKAEVAQLRGDLARLRAEGPTSLKSGQASGQATAPSATPATAGAADPDVTGYLHTHASGRQTEIESDVKEVEKGSSLLMAADMTLLLPENPGASLMVGPCYTSNQDGAHAMHTGSYTHGLSAVYALDLEVARQRCAQQEEADRIQEAFLEELEVEKKTSQQKKHKSGASPRRKKQNRRECREIVWTIVESAVFGGSQARAPLEHLDAPVSEIDCEPVPEVEWAKEASIDTGYVEEYGSDRDSDSADAQPLVEADTEPDFRRVADLKIFAPQSDYPTAACGDMDDGGEWAVVENQAASSKQQQAAASSKAEAKRLKWESRQQANRLKSPQPAEPVAEGAAQPQPKSDFGPPFKGKLNKSESGSPEASRSGRTRGNRGRGKRKNGRRRHGGKDGDDDRDGKGGDGDAGSPTATAAGDVARPVSAGLVARAPTGCAWNKTLSPLSIDSNPAEIPMPPRVAVPSPCLDLQKSSVWSREAREPQSLPSPPGSGHVDPHGPATWTPASEQMQAAKSDGWSLASLRAEGSPAGGPLPDTFEEVFVDQHPGEIKSMLESADTGLWTLSGQSLEDSIQSARTRSCFQRPLYSY